MPRKRNSGSNTNPNSSASPMSVRRSTRIKREELKSEQLLNEEAVQEVSSENEETQSKLSLPKKRTKPISPSSKSTRAKKARNEAGKQQIEEAKINESPDNGSQESETIKGKNKVTEHSSEDASTTESTSFVSLKSQKSSITTPSTIPKHDSSDMNESDPLVQAKWEIIKSQLFEVPREPRPAYREYQNKLFTKHPWLKKKDVDYLQKLFTDPKSMLAKKQFKVSIFIKIGYLFFFFEKELNR
jgi:hypothetical protein